MSKGKGPCDNCGGEHYAPDCELPRDEAKIKKAKEERAARRGGGGRGGNRGNPRGGRGDSSRQGDGGRKKWDRDARPNDHGNGVQKRGNAWMCYCKKSSCGWNKTHTSGFHAAWSREPDSFVLPNDHDFWKHSGQQPGNTSGSGASQGGGANVSAAGRSALAQIISTHQEETTDSSFSAFLSDFSKVLENLK